MGQLWLTVNSNRSEGLNVGLNNMRTRENPRDCILI